MFSGEQLEKTKATPFPGMALFVHQVFLQRNERANLL
jgi:hypothetical protein